MKPLVHRVIPLPATIELDPASNFAITAATAIVVRPADDLGTRVMLDLPSSLVDDPTATNLQWESPATVLVSTYAPTAGPAYRCDATTGDCGVVNRVGALAMGNRAWSAL